MLIKEYIYPSLNKSFLFFLLIFSSLIKGQENNHVEHPAPVIAWDVSHICYGDTTIFYNNTTGEVYDTWSFYAQVASGDSLIYQSFDVSRTIKFKFPYVGTFKVELLADNGHQVTLARYITYDSVPRANFDFQICNSQFTNFSSCFTSCFWDFGDGHTSTQASPVHFYSSIGTYSPKLKIRNGTRTDSTVVDINVNTINNILGTFKYRYEKDSLSFQRDSVYFQANDSTGGIYFGYHWAFGDGATADLTGISGGKKIRHHYDHVDSTYYVFLLVKTFCFFAYSEQSVYIPDTAAKKAPSTQLNNNNTTTVIFPNPNSNDNMIHLLSSRKNEITDIQIIDCLGRKLDSSTIPKPGGYDINLSVFPRGIYFIRIFFGNEVITEKIIRQ